MFTHNFAKSTVVGNSSKSSNHAKVAFFAIMLIAASAFGAATTKPDSVVIDTSSAKGEVIQQSSNYYGSQDASKAFDGDYATDNGRWMSTKANLPAWYVYKFTEATEVRGLRLRTKSSTRAPKAWTFKGSYTGEDGTWVDLGARASESWSSNEVRDYTLENIAAYQYYKFTCSQNNGDSYFELRETEFLSSCVADITTPNAGDIVSQSPEFVYNEVHYAAKAAFNNNKLFGDGSRWIATMPAGGAYVVYKFNEATRVNGISLTIPNYGTQTTRAPKDWTFSGSDDGETWDLLDTQTGETAWSSGGEERYYKFTNTHSYQYYKFNCTATNGDASMQLIEIEFYYTSKPYLGECAVQYVSDTSCTVSATLAENGADRLYYILSEDGVTATTNQFATSSVSEGGTATETITGLTPGKTYAIGVIAENAAGSDVALAGFLYTGELSLGAVSDANESGLVQGTVEVSRPTADVLPLTVTYTITGSSGTDGVTWEAPVTVTIPSGATTGYLVVNPLLDLTVAENVVLTVALAGGNYAIPAAPDNAKAMTLYNSDAPAGFDIVTITNAFDNPFGGYLQAGHAEVFKNGFSNLTARIIRFVRPEDAPEGLREFAHNASEANVESSASVFPRDWMFYSSFNTAGSGSTQTSVRYASATLSGLTAKKGVRVYAGSWYIPQDKAGTYSFRMHMAHVGLFSLDGKRILRQFNTSEATATDVVLSAGWHNFYVAFVAGSSATIGPASGETLGLSFSAENAALTKDAPGSAFGPFDSVSGYRFSTAFNAALVPSMMAKGGDVFIDCANVLGDLRITGQLGHAGYYYRIVNLPAGRTVELGRPAYFNQNGWQNLELFAGVDWTHMVLPTGVNVRFEGAAVVDRSWTAAGYGVWNGSDHSAFALGKGVFMATDVPNLLGTYTDEFHYPDGLLYLQAGDKDVIGSTAKIYVPDNLQFGFGGAPFVFTVSGTTMNLPMKRSGSSWHLPNEIELGSGAVVSGSMGSSTGDEYHGDVTGADARFVTFGWARYLTMRGSVNVKNVDINQRGDRVCLKPKTGSDPSSVSGTVKLGSESSAYSSSGWNYPGAILFYCPETPEEHPLSINTVSAGNAYLYSQNGNYARQGSTLSTCSNSTVNVSTLTGVGIHLCASIPPVVSSAKAAGFANFVFGEINSTATAEAMKVFVASNVNITVTNIVKKTGEGLPAVAFDYTLVSNNVVMADGPNAGILDIVGECPESTIRAQNIESLPGRIKGFVGDITLVDTPENRTYDVVYDFDRGVAIGGCDGSGNLVAAPWSGTINLTLTGIPKTGTWGILKFDSVPEGQFTNWTVNAPTTYNNYVVSVEKTPTGFVLHAGKGLMLIVR